MENYRKFWYQSRNTNVSNILSHIEKYKHILHTGVSGEALSLVTYCCQGKNIEIYCNLE